MGGGGKRLVKQRERLWKKNPHCENCGIETILPKHCPRGKKGRIIAQDHMATIQHKYSRLHPDKRRTMILDHENDRRHFLWCYKCNRLDNDAELAAIAAEFWKNINERNGNLETNI